MQEKRSFVQLEGDWQLWMLCAHPSHHNAKALEQIFKYHLFRRHFVSPLKQ
jgi:hypothetical protein